MTTILTAEADVVSCPDCGTRIAASLLSCPGCHRLVHGDALKDHAARAEAAEREGDLPGALAAWRVCLDLLPADSRQYGHVSERMAALAKHVDAQAAGPVPTSGRWKWLATLGPAGLLIWKFKFLIVALLSKGKLLLFGLTKIGTLASMFATVGLYWTVWGLWFAVGLVVSIYIHEMGHVAALRRYGIAASAPMFIPGFGALVRMKQRPLNAREDARIGLAGPLWGLGAAVAALGGAFAGGGGRWAAVAHTGAWLNLFNLMPIWQLDGGRAFAPLTRGKRWLAVAALAGAYGITRDGIVLLVLMVAVWRAFAASDETEDDWGALALYVFLVLALAGVFVASQRV